MPFVAVDQAGFEALFADGKLTGNASVYLTEDITLGSEYKLNGNTLNLCLHNKTITIPALLSCMRMAPPATAILIPSKI